MPRYLCRLLVVLFFTASQALASPAVLCDRAALAAAAATGVPPRILLALTRVETGREMDGALRPWPWAVHHDGKALWFASAAAAEGYVAARLAEGESNLDIGCFQINHHWHADAFSSLSQMFEPGQNALHAARYLADRRLLADDWLAAAGAYHSATPDLAQGYANRFARVLAGLDAPPLASSSPQNRFPLLVGGKGPGASLVPVVGGEGALISGWLR